MGFRSNLSKFPQKPVRGRYSAFSLVDQTHKEGVLVLGLESIIERNDILMIQFLEYPNFMRNHTGFVIDSLFIDNPSRQH